MTGAFGFHLGGKRPPPPSSGRDSGGSGPGSGGSGRDSGSSGCGSGGGRDAVAAAEVASINSKKSDFRDNKSVKSDKSERGDMVRSEASCSKSKSNQGPGKVSRGENSLNSFLPSSCYLGRRINEARPVYRPGQSKPRSRFSLRNLLYTNPLHSPPFSNSPSTSRSRKQKEKEGDTQSEGSWVERGSQGTVSSAQHSQIQNSSSLQPQFNDIGLRECTLCLAECTADQFPALHNCSHLSCIVCLQQYVRIEIQEGRANLKCPQCNQQIHPNDLEFLVGEDTALLHLYQFLMVRRVLAADPDTRWCPAPNCSYAVVATGCASCPKLDCEREGCDSSFCYHCKQEWHPNITCDKARAQRHPIRSGSEDSGVGGGLEIKVCPRCSVLIVKMDDGSCNHMTCAVCGSEFCWLCMKEISDLHYLSPSGCTFWGKKPWSRKKKLMWQLGTIVGAPVGIALIAGISVPAMVIGIPVWVGRKINARHLFSSKGKRISAITAGVFSSILVSPVLACLAVSIGVPILLAYVYGVVPLSLCRSGGCGVRTTEQGVVIEMDDEVPYNKVNQAELTNRVANPSIGELSLGASLSMGSGSHLDRLVECDRESASNTAIAGYSLTGSVASSYLGQHRLEVGADVHTRKKFSFSSERLSETVSLSEKSATVSLGDDGASTRALAGSILHYKMENTSVNSYRTGGVTPGSCGSAVSAGVSFKQDGDSVTYPSGDEISLRSLPAQRSLSPVTLTGEELTAALRRSGRRRVLEKQQSETSGDEPLKPDQDCFERVRFDSHISFMDAGSPSAKEEQDRQARLQIKKVEPETETLREETAEELALVVSPVTHRGPSPLDYLVSPSSPRLTSPLERLSSPASSPLSPTEMSPMLSLAQPFTPLTSHATSSSFPITLASENNVSLVQIEGPELNVTNISIGADNTSFCTPNSTITISSDVDTTVDDNTFSSEAPADKNTGKE